MNRADRFSCQAAELSSRTHPNVHSMPHSHLSNYRHSTAEGIGTQQGSHFKFSSNVVQWVGG
jgi:hypothetical protein